MAKAWNRDNRDVMMYCFFKRCYDGREQFKQCLHFARGFLRLCHWA